MTDEAFFADVAATELIEAADRKRRAVRRPLRLAVATAAEREDQPISLDDIAEVEEALADDQPTTRRRRRRAPAKAGIFDAVEESASAAADPDGLVTRGVHAGLDGFDWMQGGARRFGPWGIAAALVVLILLVMSFYAGSQAPPPMPVTNVRVTFLPGPRLPPQEVMGWLGRFSYRDQLKEPQPWVLDKLADFLRQQPMVAEVRPITVIHEPDPRDEQNLRRTMELAVGLRQPVMPVVLASGERAWVDQEGQILPGALPGPSLRRPALRAIEQGGIVNTRAALALWAQLEPQLEPGLVTDIHLYDRLDVKGVRRGIVLYTRQGSRLIWGSPSEERYGVRSEDKLRDLIHTIRCQGDLGRIATINVRFRQPFFILREAVR